MGLFSKSSKLLLPLLSVLSAILIFSVLFAHDAVNESGISNLKIYSNDGRIDLVWDTTGAGAENVTELTVTSTNQHSTIKLSPETTSYAYTAGNHAEQYNFTVVLKDPQTAVGSACSATALFLDYSKLPDLPIIQIETTNQMELPYTVISAPEGCWGVALSDNAYIDAKISVPMETGGEMNLSGQIRIRGNTSALGEKKPYKLKLEHGVDLLGLGKDYADKDWVLLPFCYQFKTISGQKVSELCGLDWQPRSVPVSVIINGDWKGCYLLMESVKVSEKRVNISKEGFLIENDAYWWKESETYFKTEHQRQELAYTFQFPPEQTLSDTIVHSVSGCVTAYERALLEQQGDYTDYIDIDSFAAWLLAHDILGTWDSGGSNMYLYKYDMGASSKLRLGPLWDFSSVFQQTNQWANIHISNSLHYDVLLQDQEFVHIYQEKWAALSESLSDEMNNFLADYINEYGAALEQSLELDKARYGVDEMGDSTVSEGADIVRNWFETRTAWMKLAVPEI